MSSNKLALRSFEALMQKAAPQLARHAVNGVSIDRIIAGAHLAAVTNPDLLNCSPQSVLVGVYQAARLGLEIGGPMGRAYLVPYAGKAQLVVGYKGMIELALRSGRIAHIIARVVRGGDTFDVEQGTSGRIYHVPRLNPPAGAGVTHAYAVATLPSGQTVFDWMTAAEITEIQQRSPAGSSGPWVTDWEAMAKKTVVRRLANYLPLTPELAAAMELAGREAGEEQTPTPILDPEQEIVVEAEDVEVVPTTGG